MSLRDARQDGDVGVSIDRVSIGTPTPQRERGTESQLADQRLAASGVSTIVERPVNEEANAGELSR
jgi:hypothetical protein